MTKPRCTLYAYVEGADLAGVAPLVESQWSEYVAQGPWRFAQPVVVNQRHPRTADMRADDLPGWDLGVNLHLPEIGQEPPGWFADVEKIAACAGSIYALIQRPVVLGLWDSQRKISEDLFDVDSSEPNIQELRAVLGVDNAR